MQNLLVEFLFVVFLLYALPIFIKRGDDEGAEIWPFMWMWAASGFAWGIGKIFTERLGFYYENDTITTIIAIFVCVISFLVHLLVLKGINKLIDKLIKKEPKPAQTQLSTETSQ